MSTPAQRHGRGVIVTGAASGIGRAVACLLAGEGYVVTALDLNARGLEQLLEEGRSQHWTLATAVIDVCDREALTALCQQVSHSPTPLTAFVHCAGITWRGRILEMSDAEYERIVEVNLKGSFIALTSAAQAMVAQAVGGSIVAITSVNAQRPLATQAVYSATKAALEVLVQTLSVELGTHGIRVNSVAPGAVDTPMNPRIREQAALFRGLPLGRVGTAPEIAQAVSFLVSEAASYITGACLVVDGGLVQVRA